MKIGAREIGPGHPPYVVAEMSCEHLGKIENARALICAAKDAGADAVKLQLYDPVRLAEARGGRNKKAPAPWSDLTLGQLYAKAHTPRHWFPALFDDARFAGIALFSSIFDEECVDFLEKLDCPAYKISSFDLTNLPLIRKAASTGKPVIVSTGMGSDQEISDAAATAWYASEHPYPDDCGGQAPALLHCISAYPADVKDANLSAMQFLGAINFAGPIGFSDHTLGSTAAIAATALGASIIEKHVTLDRSNGGPDASFSLDPSEFKKFCQDVKDAYASLGNGERPQSEIYHSLRVKRA